MCLALRFLLERSRHPSSRRYLIDCYDADNETDCKHDKQESLYLFLLFQLVYCQEVDDEIFKIL